MLNKNDCKILGLALIPAMAIFIGFSIKYDTPLIFDDYRYLNTSSSEYFKFSDIGPFISRSPLFAMMLFILLKLDFLQSSFWFFINFFFAFHVLTVGLVILYVVKSIGLEDLLKEQKYKILIIVSIFVLAFYPNFLELVVWPSATPFFIGGFLMALGLFARSYYLKAFLFLCSYSTYETFIIPSVILSILPYLINFNSNSVFNYNWKMIFKEVAVFLMAFLVFGGLRLSLGQVYGNFQQNIEWPSWNNFIRLWTYVYKTEYHTPVWGNKIEYLVFTILFIVLSFRRPISIVYLSIITVLMIISGLHDLVIPYPGYRIIYGTFLIRCAIITVSIILCARYTYSYFGLVLLLGLFVPYIYSNRETWKIRTYDAKVLEKNYDLVNNIYKNSTSLATVVIGDYTKGFHPQDWVVDENSPLVLDIFKRRIKIDKPLKLVFINGDTNIYDLPRIYPSCYMNRSIGSLVPDKDALTGEAVYAHFQDESNYLVLGPHTTLDSGTYLANFRLKNGSFVQDGSEVASIEVVSDDGRINVGKVLLSDEFDKNVYKTFSLGFSVIGKKTDVKMRVLFKSNSCLFADYISISRR